MLLYINLNKVKHSYFYKVNIFHNEIMLKLFLNL